MSNRSIKEVKDKYGLDIAMAYDFEDVDFFIDILDKMQTLIDSWDDMDINDYPLCQGVILDMIAELKEIVK